MKESDASRNAANNARCALVNGGTQVIYGGTPPANVAASLSSNPVLATLTYAATAFGNSVAGVATANTITGDTAADATGTATFSRSLTSGGVATFQHSVSANGGAGEVQFASVSFVQNLPVNLTSMTITQPDGA